MNNPSNPGAATPLHTIPPAWLRTTDWLNPADSQGRFRLHHSGYGECERPEQAIRQHLDGACESDVTAEADADPAAAPAQGKGA